MERIAVALLRVLMEYSTVTCIVTKMAEFQEELHNYDRAGILRRTAAFLRRLD